MLRHLPFSFDLSEECLSMSFHEVISPTFDLGLEYTRSHSISMDNRYVVHLFRLSVLYNLEEDVTA